MIHLRPIISTAIVLSAPSLFASEALVTTDWVAKNADKPNVRIIEVSTNVGLYEKGHLPNAHNVSWHHDLVDRVRRDIISKEQFEALASRLGITPDTTVVLYGDNSNWFAAWGAWLFNVYGHGDVRLVDGGRQKWEAEKRPYSVEAPAVKATDYKVSGVNADLRAKIGDVVAVAEGREKAKLVDIRSPDEFSGKIIAPPGFQETAVRAGHVPGALNVPWKSAVNEDGTFKSVEDLRKIYGEKGIDGSVPLIVYCRIGERSAHTWFALNKVLGYKNTRQYDGSWTEYGNAVGVPIDNPAGTVWTGQ